MALDPVVNQLREIAFSGAATLADIPFLAQRIKQEQTGQFGQTSPGLEAAEAGRGGGSGLGAGLFETPADVGVAAGGGGFSGVSSLDDFAQAFSSVGSRPPNFGGRGGSDAESGDVSVAAADFSTSSEIGKALAAFAALTGIPAGPISNTLSELFGPFGVVGPSRPAIGTQAFSDIVGATQQAREINDRIADLEGALGRDLSPAERSIAEASFEEGPSLSDPGFAESAGRGGTEGGGSSTGGGGVSGGPGAGAGPGGSGPGQAGSGPAGTGPSGPGGGGGGGGPGGGGGSGGGGGGPEGGGGPSGGRHIGGIVSEDERPGITAGDVPNQLLQEGEFIVRREAVQNIGEPFMDALNILAANFDPKKARNALRELLR